MEQKIVSNRYKKRFLSLHQDVYGKYNNKWNDFMQE